MKKSLYEHITDLLQWQKICFELFAKKERKHKEKRKSIL